MSQADAFIIEVEKLSKTLTINILTNTLMIVLNF